jgi:arsenite transporter
MWEVLSVIQKKLTWSIPVTMLAGIILGFNFDLSILKSLILPFTFLMVYPMMINMDILKIFEKGGGKLQTFTQILNFMVIPFIAYFIGLYFFTNPYYRMGILLASLLPTSGMTISWTGFAGGNLKAAIKMTVIGLVIGSIATPLYIKALLGTVLEIPLLNVFKQIMIVVFIPIVGGILTRKFIIWKSGNDYFQVIKKKFPLMSTIGVLGIVFVAMALKAKSIVSSPETIVSILIPLTLLYLINFVLSTIVAKKFFKYEDGIALVYGTVMRNLSIALAIAMTVFGDKGADVAIIIAFAYIIQVQAGAWYAKFSNKIFQVTNT